MNPASSTSAPTDSAAPSKSVYKSLLGLAIPPALNYAQQWLTQENLEGLLEKLPDSLSDTGSATLASFRKLSTVEKVAGGLLLVLFVRHFLRGDRA